MTHRCRGSNTLAFLKELFGRGSPMTVEDDFRRQNIPFAKKFYSKEILAHTTNRHKTA